MRNLLIVLSVAVLVGVTVYVNPAQGADIYKSTATASDGGGTNLVTLQAQGTYKAQCSLPACTHFDAGNVDCTKDAVMPLNLGPVAGSGAPAVYETTFESASHTSMRFGAVDGGNVSCNVYLQTRNLPR